MNNTKITIRAFNKDLYHRDIMIANSQQVVIQDTRLGDPVSSMHSGLIGHGVRINPKDFPEMEYFEVVISNYP